MAVCTYDNPATMTRECWCDGRLICSYSASLLMSKLFMGDQRHFFFGANIGPWITGQLFGDRSAMESNGNDELANAAHDLKK